MDADRKPTETNKMYVTIDNAQSNSTIDNIIKLNNLDNKTGDVLSLSKVSQHKRG
jgi:hypothetical protein